MDIKTILHELSTEVVAKLAWFDVKAITADEKNWTFEVIASDETVDRAWEVIEVVGWETTNYMKNPIILFGHDYRDIDNIIGRATEVINNGKQLIVKGVFASTEAGQTARQLYDEGILKTVSVWFIPLERWDGAERHIIKRAELLELSFVPVPCNPNALDIMKEMKELQEKGIQYWILVKEEETPETPEQKTLESKVDLIIEKMWIIENQITEIKWFLVSKKETDGNEDTDKATEEAKQAMQKIAVIASTAIKHLKN